MRRTVKRRKNKASHEQATWLPIDQRLIPDIFSFGHVKGFSKVFLTTEMILVSLCVIGSLALGFIKLLQ